ncbi:MAG: 5-formyltetrahydrofolate cyclo-ligase [Crocinitomicaceae bacterium]|jgi:5-formyltetrahydrofolate cyclo-ligase|nr:5-formyltetrahydrofolate cyclo-ligase [Crocinitomicaceae bacterium]MDG1658054.1 5-formyltetrahydrofolate cyclo-ligase [Crocinitomicaceae bacterium]MDG2441357.1 5-formyltetrahydrofolate cyclo-ligase [Crocinitomicaceae bacterium]|tara:strand:- start:4226 stop:4792 length:567 start_codon:yes stop_codon:yes gene_type:complete
MTKQELREHYMSKRAALSPRQLEEISASICHTVFSKYQLEGKKISLFLPIERKKEINTYRIWEKAMSFGAQVAVPKANMKTNELKQVLFESVDQLESSPFSIPEPKKGRVIAAEHFDYVFVPLLAIDKKGNRVGYGKGFYDRFLKKCPPRCTFIGLSHFDDLEDEIGGMEFTDIRLNACITPNKIYRF